jgi:hypothetical protein
MIKRFIAAAVAAALVVAGAVAVSSSTPSAAATLSPTEVSGNFAGDAREEVFAYTAGTAPDYLVSFANQGVSCGQLTWARYAHTVNGTFYPVAGNFDGDAYDEIFWHAPGAAQDYLMNFTSFTATTVIPFSVAGDYIPIAGDFTADGVDDIMWYAPGTARDAMWDFNPGGGFDDAPFTISGTYRPVAGSFGSDATDDILWYAPGTTTDYFWDFLEGTHDYEPSVLPVSGNYRPFSLDIYGDGPQGGDIFWYAPGTADDYVWDFVEGEYESTLDPVVGNYRPTSGDYFNDGRDDILWMVPDGTRFYLWDHSSADGRPVDRCIYSGLFSATAAATRGVAGTPVGPVGEDADAATEVDTDTDTGG